MKMFHASIVIWLIAALSTAAFAGTVNNNKDGKDGLILSLDAITP